ncbi:hypothetical protein E2C06_08460 [Dankookia rubra]|uniref:Uncharacterized protein n=1 Tax=Dankookia rubra TaxID=1442381 RepID=A0A4R5QK28_9PROT|nr:hypothetical protein [Dankookia rubra]TDH63017.1 hypothetical protein E2C06_08460 [Dankookia rubra]
MRGWAAGMMVGALALSSCGSRSTGVVEGADGLLNLTVSGPSLAAATERGLHDATAHCAGQGRQTQILGTQMGRDDYRLAFRCTGRIPVPGAAPVATVPPAAPQMVLLRPEMAPVLSEGIDRRPMALPPPQATLSQQSPAASAMILLQPAKAPGLGSEGLDRRADPQVKAAPAEPRPVRLPPIASPLPRVSAFPPTLELPPVAATVPLSTPPSRLLALPPPAPSLPPGAAPLLAPLATAMTPPPLIGPVGPGRD